MGNKHSSPLQRLALKAIEDPTQGRRVKRLWNKLDTDASKALDYKEFSSFIVTTLLSIQDGDTSFLPNHDVSVGDRERWTEVAFAAIDTNKDGYIDYDEFVAFMRKPFDAGLENHATVSSPLGAKADINADLNYLGPKCKDCEAWKTPDYLQASNVAVEHVGCPMKRGPDPGEEFVAGSNPCKPFNPVLAQAISSLSGYWEGYDETQQFLCSWSVDALDARPVRNKRFLNDQCLQVINYEYIEKDQKNASSIAHFEKGMLLVEWNAPGENEASSHRISGHFVSSHGKKDCGIADVVLLNPVERGLLMDVTPRDVDGARRNTKEPLSVAGQRVLGASKDLTLNFFWDMLGGDHISHTSCVPPAQPDMSYSVAILGLDMVIATHNVPSRKNGIVTLRRYTDIPKYLPPFVGIGDELHGSDEWKGWIHTINELVGNWQSTRHFSKGNPAYGDLCAVTCPPHHVTTKEALQTQNLPPILAITGIPGDLQIFTLCSHAHTVDTFTVTRNPVISDANAELQLLNYNQKIVDSYGNGVHEEVGFFVFDWERREVARFGVIPHGSSFAMSGKLQHQTRPLGWIHTSTLPHFAPNFNDGLDPTVPGSNNKSATFLSGLEAGPTCNVFREKPYVSLHNPAKLLHDINYPMEKDLKQINTLNLTSGKSMDLFAVNELSHHNIAPNHHRTADSIAKHQFVNDISTQFYLSEYKTNPTTLQYVQTLNFDFAVKGTPELGNRASTKDDKEREVLRWPHIIVSSLEKKGANGVGPALSIHSSSSTTSSINSLASSPISRDSPHRNRKVSEGPQSLTPDRGRDSGRVSPNTRGRPVGPAVLQSLPETSSLSVSPSMRSTDDHKDFHGYCREMTQLHRGLPQFQSSPLLKKKLHHYRQCKAQGLPISPEEIEALQFELLQNAGIRQAGDLLRWAKNFNENFKCDDYVPKKNWHNWSKTVACNVDLKQPSDVKELKKIIRAARAEGKKIRVVGDGHSWSPIIAAENCILLQLVDAKWKKIKAKKIGSQKCVKVGAGVTTGDLAVWFDSKQRKSDGSEMYNMGLESDAVLDTVRYASLALSCCHGLSNSGGSLPDAVEELEFMNYTGAVVVYKRKECEPALWKCIAGSFGLIGVCTSLTLQVTGKPAVANTSTDWKLSFLLHSDSRVIKEWALNTTNRAGEKVPCTGIEVFWFPLASAKVHSHQGLETWNPEKDRLYTRHLRDLTPEEEDRKQYHPIMWDATWKETYFLGRGFVDYVEIFLGKEWTNTATHLESPVLAMLFPKFELTRLPKGSEVVSRSVANHYKSNINVWNNICDIELCFRLDEDWTIFPNLIKAAVDITTKWIHEKHTNPCDVGLEFRITRGSNILLSPAYCERKAEGDPYFLYLEVLGSAGNKGWWEEYAISVRDAWLALDPSAKPHWCKWHEAEDASFNILPASPPPSAAASPTSKHRKSAQPSGRSTPTKPKPIPTILTSGDTSIIVDQPGGRQKRPKSNSSTVARPRSPSPRAPPSCARSTHSTPPHSLSPQPSGNKLSGHPSSSFSESLSWKSLFQKQYGKELKTFAEVVSKLDPEGMFRTPFWDAMLFGAYE